MRNLTVVSVGSHLQAINRVAAAVVQDERDRPHPNSLRGLLLTILDALNNTESPIANPIDYAWSELHKVYGKSLEAVEVNEVRREK